MSDRLSFRDRVALYFTAYPGWWIDSSTLETLGGRMAWRTRVSDCRTELGMNIENRQRKTEAGVTISEYRFLPAETPATVGHDMNAPSEGRLI